MFPCVVLCWSNATAEERGTTTTTTKAKVQTTIRGSNQEKDNNKGKADTASWPCEGATAHACIPACLLSFPPTCNPSPCLVATPLHAWRPACLRICLSVSLPCKALVRLRARRRFTSYNVFMTAPWRPLYCQLYWKFQWPLKRAVRAATLKSLHRIIELGMQDCEPMRVANHGPAMERGRS